MLHDGFNDFVKQSWDTDLSWKDNSNCFKDIISQWNKDVFGDIFKRKKCILNRLQGIDKILDHRYREDLILLKSILWDDLNDVLR